MTLLHCTDHGNVFIHDPAALYCPCLWRHSLTLLHCTVHGYVVIHWSFYIVLSMAMSSFIDPAPIVLYLAMSSFIDPPQIVLSIVISSFIDPATLYCPWLCRHSLTLLHRTVHGYVVIHWPCYIVLFMVMSSFMFVIVLVRKDINVNDRRDHPTLHLDTN